MYISLNISRGLKKHIFKSSLFLLLHLISFASSIYQIRMLLHLFESEFRFSCPKSSDKKTCLAGLLQRLK